VTCFVAVRYLLHEQTCFYLPDAAKAYERSARTWGGIFLADLVENSPSLDEVCVATEGYEG
jgi:hypothetical protein